MIWFYILLPSSAIAIGWITQWGIDAEWWPNPTYYLELDVSMAVLTAIICFFLLLRFKESTDFIAPYYFATIIIKMIFGLLLIALVISKDPAHASENTVFFLIVYLFFTFLEVVFLVQISKSTGTDGKKLNKN